MVEAKLNRIASWQVGRNDHTVLSMLVLSLLAGVGVGADVRLNGKESRLRQRSVRELPNLCAVRGRSDDLRNQRIRCR